jgi:hypothetical protein
VSAAPAEISRVAVAAATRLRFAVRDTGASSRAFLDDRVAIATRRRGAR